MSKTHQQAKVLVIGHGNTGRSDDGIGQEVAAAIGAWNLPAVRAIRVQQLLPELVEALAEAQEAIFVDADIGLAAGEVRVEDVVPLDRSSPFDHVIEPSGLLALVEALFGRHPAAWKVGIGVRDLSVGDSLSQIAQVAKAAAIERIELLLRTEAARTPFTRLPA